MNMGVTRQRRNPCSIDAEDEDTGLISSIMDEPIIPPSSSDAEAKPSSSKKNRKYRPRYWYVENAKAQKTKFGVRQSRRIDNLNQLLSMTDSLDLEEEDISSFLEPASTPFSKLFHEQEKMKIWNDFVNRSEEQQLQVLNGMSWDSDNDDDVDDVTEKWEKIKQPDLSESWEDLTDDKREIHPGYSAEECFKRIDSHLRKVLNRKHVPIGILAKLEEEVTGFFKMWPTSVFISELPSSFDRLLMHALCQYLDLKSRSFNDDHGVRQTQVENRNALFSPPKQSLTEYLESKH